jgi:hypothetical protein|tara:strand:- start:232 stop:372 length:141 start_codon:yes stop_codon:yes gene_type:complete
LEVVELENQPVVKQKVTVEVILYLVFQEVQLHQMVVEVVELEDLAL